MHLHCLIVFKEGLRIRELLHKALYKRKELKEACDIPFWLTASVCRPLYSDSRYLVCMVYQSPRSNLIQRLLTRISITLGAESNTFDILRRNVELPPRIFYTAPPLQPAQRVGDYGPVTSP